MCVRNAIQANVPPLFRRSTPWMLVYFPAQAIWTVISEPPRLIRQFLFHHLGVLRFTITTGLHLPLMRPPQPLKFAPSVVLLETGFKQQCFPLPIASISCLNRLAWGIFQPVPAKTLSRMVLQLEKPITSVLMEVQARFVITPLMA